MVGTVPSSGARWPNRSADGRRMISGDDAGRVIVWEWPTDKPGEKSGSSVSEPRPIATWNGVPRGWIIATALSADGKRGFVSEYAHRRGDFDRPPPQARVYDLVPRERQEKPVEKQGSNAGSPLPYRAKLALDLIEVWIPGVKKRDSSYGYSTKWKKLVKRGLVAAAFSPDGKHLALGQGGETDKGEVWLIDATSGKRLRKLTEHRYGATDLVFSADGSHVISVGRDTTVRVGRVKDGKTVAELGKPRGGQFKDWLHAVALSPNQRLIAAADMAGAVHVWRLG